MFYKIYYIQIIFASSTLISLMCHIGIATGRVGHG